MLDHNSTPSYFAHTLSGNQPTNAPEPATAVEQPTPVRVAPTAVDAPVMPTMIREPLPTEARRADLGKPPQGSTQGQGLPPGAPISVLMRGLYSESNPRREAEISTLVVLGTVTDILPSQWTTSDGKKPPNLDGSNYSVGALTIVTPHRIKIEQTFKGSFRSRELHVFVHGGSVGNDQIRYGDNQTSVQLGQRFVFFLGRERDIAGQSGHSEAVSRYVIDGNGRAHGVLKSFSIQEIADAAR